ncbi:MAG: GntP family permease [Youngiibacter sp.]|nr:GntP family permease [Youngiibacter sp.]
MLGIFVALFLLMFLAYRGMSILWIAPICAAVVAFTGGLPLLPTYTDTYMAGFVSFTKAWFPAFMLGGIFGRLMEISGGAQSVAHFITGLIGKKRAILAVSLGCIVLGYGGISVFVIAFAMYPLAVAVFREANITRKLIPGTLAFGMFTIAMTSLPGTPQIQNLIPMQYFKTTPTAAPITGIVTSIFMGVAGYLFLVYREKKYTAKGEVFTEPTGQAAATASLEKLPSPILSFLPLLAVVIVLNVLKQNIVIALISGVLLSIIVNFPAVKKNIIEIINKGAANSVMAIINTSAAVGFGAVVRAVPGFKTLTDMVLGIEGNPLISEAIAVNILAGATGSASGGMGIALAALGQKYMELAASTGISPESFHRVASIASGGLDSLPHNGAILTVLAICAMTHKDSYFEMFVTTVVIPVVATAIAVVMGSMGIL